MPSVAIFGAGVGGLSCAHELSRAGFTVNIYEKKNVIGGLARSSRDNQGCATECSWRVFFSQYNNVFRIMSQIPTSNGTVLNNLTAVNNLNISDTPTTMIDGMKIAYNMAYGLTSCDARLTQLDNLAWNDTLPASNKSNVIREIGPFFGLDKDKGSYNSVIKTGLDFAALPGYLDKSKKNYITTKPTTEAWFDPWRSQLQAQGASFHLSTELVSIAIANNHVQSAYVLDTISNAVTQVIADYYVFSIPVNMLASLINSTPQLFNSSLRSALELNDTCLQLQPCFQVYFDRPISLGVKNGAEINSFLIVDSPWDLIILMYDKVFDSPICAELPQVYGAWSVGACESNKPGVIYGKTLRQCTYDEIIVELWAQLIRSPGLRAAVHNNNDFDLNESLVVKWSDIWPTFYFAQGTLESQEPKFTNNAGSLTQRPHVATSINNLFLATGYAREALNVFSMEGACISGVMAAHLIASNVIAPPVIVPRSRLFEPARRVDQFCYDHGLPNISPIIFSPDYIMYAMLSSLQ
jgi:uncharacterized protein with NAD-binding domain and iron-sulfur cluster